MEKYLIFKTAAADSICLPARELSHMHIDGAGTALDFNFINSATGDDGLGEFNIPVVINDNKGREVIQMQLKTKLGHILLLALRLFTSTMQLLLDCTFKTTLRLTAT